MRKESPNPKKREAGSRTVYFASVNYSDRKIEDISQN